MPAESMQAGMRASTIFELSELNAMIFEVVGTAVIVLIIVLALIALWHVLTGRK